MITLATGPMLRCQRCGMGQAYDEPLHCCYCGAQLVEVTDDTLVDWTCMCGEPMQPGIVHRTDGPCYYLEPSCPAKH